MPITNKYQSNWETDRVVPGAAGEQHHITIALGYTRVVFQLMVTRLLQAGVGVCSVGFPKRMTLVFCTDTMAAVYDLIAERRTSRIPAHEDDVNSCCWADSSSGNVLISASDDTFLKVW